MQSADCVIIRSSLLAGRRCEGYIAAFVTSLPIETNNKVVNSLELIISHGASKC